MTSFKKLEKVLKANLRPISDIKEQVFQNETQYSKHIQWNTSNYFGINVFSNRKTSNEFSFSIGNNAWFGLDG